MAVLRGEVDRVHRTFIYADNPDLAMSQNHSGRHSNNRRRRQILKAAGAVGAVGLAGCLGDDGDDDGDDGTDDSADDGTDDTDDDHSLVLGTASEASSNFQMMSALGGVINDNSDNLYLDVRPSDSMRANPGALERDEIQLGLIENTTADDFQADMEPFDQLDVDLRLIAHGSTSDWFLAAADDEYTTLNDIDSDTTVAPGLGSVGAMVMRALELDDITPEESGVGYGDIGSALSEGRIDVGIASEMNVLIDPTTPAWVTDIAASVDGRILGMNDEHHEAVQEARGMDSFEFTPTSADSWEHVPDPVRSMSQITWIYGTADTPYDAVYELLETMYENREGLSDYHDMLRFYEEDDHWANEPHDGFEYHDASQDFFEEHDLI